MIFHYNATSKETALVKENWPWGFKLKSPRRFWIETGRKGQREASQQKNPKTGLWCKPRRTTYSMAMVLAEDTSGLVSTYSISHYDDIDKIEDFYNEHKEGLHPSKSDEIDRFITAKKLVNEAFKTGAMRYEIKSTGQMRVM
jgi:hypothetical protein